MSTTTQTLASRPLFFERNRVFRIYQGGALFHPLFGDPAEDNNYPEEWIASSVKALNKVSAGEHEGISRIQGTDVYLDELLRAEPERMLGGRKDIGILVKALDSAVALPIQAHPTKERAMQLFQSPYGKTESWLVLDARPGASIAYGFKRPVTKAEFQAAIHTGTQAVNALLNVIPVKPGDVFLIPGGMVHAIGAGCLMLEVQEPTDFTIQPEEWLGDYHLSEYERFLSLSEEDAFSCFDYDMYGEKALERGRMTPKTLYKEETRMSEQLIGYEDTPCFALRRHTLRGGEYTLPTGPAVFLVGEGSGTVGGDGFLRDVKKGNYFLLPYAAAGKYTVEGELTLLECLPPKE